MSAKQMKNAAEVGRINLGGFRRRRLLSRRLGCPMDVADRRRMGTAVHPMTALTYFFARLVRGGGQGSSQSEMAELAHLRSRFGAMFQIMPSADQ
jgi:hypothetical protein